MLDAEFSDEIEDWVIEEFKMVWIQQKYLETRCRRFSKKNRPRRGNDSCHENIERRI
jgi:hypothetical protein